MILLDTTVLVYAVGADHPLREPCRGVLLAHADGRIEAATTIEILQEFTHVRAQRRPRSDAVSVARHYRQALPLITVDSNDFELGLTLFEAHPALGAFDAVVAAIALNRSCEALISADRAFGTVPQLPWIDAASPMLNQLIRSA